MKKSRIASVVLCAASVAAQDKKEPPKPSEEVDKALRSRIDFFYQAHVDGKFRLADQAVAEESKDDFFAAPKKRWEKCEIGQISYGGDFKTAHAVTLCKTEMVVHGTTFPITAPVPSDWKLEDGQWFWVFKKTDVVESPFGPMKVRAPKEDGGAAAPQTLPRVDPNALARDIWKQVSADKRLVVFDPAHAGSAEIKVSNGMPGPIQIAVSQSTEVEGLSVSVGNPQIPAGSSTTVALAFKPGAHVPSGSAHYRISVQQTGQIIPFEVKFVTAAR